MGAPCFAETWGFSARYRASSMPKNLKRYYGFGHLHFITFSCYRRLPLLGTARSRNAFVRALLEVRAKFGMALAGYVVMPEAGGPGLSASGGAWVPHVSHAKRGVLRSARLFLSAIKPGTQSAPIRCPRRSKEPHARPYGTNMGHPHLGSILYGYFVRCYPALVMHEKNSFRSWATRLQVFRNSPASSH